MYAKIKSLPSSMVHSAINLEIVHTKLFNFCVTTQPFLLETYMDCLKGSNLI